MVKKIPLPADTCPKIDAVLKDAVLLGREAFRLYQQKHNVEIYEAIAFVDGADTFFRSLPDVLEELRHANSALREAAWEYYARLKALEQEA
jgi:hypothetical protein